MFVVPMFVRKLFVRVRLGQVVTNILHTYTHTYHTNICILTLAYELFRMYFFSNEPYPLRTFAYEQLCTNFTHTNYFHTYFDPRIVQVYVGVCILPSKQDSICKILSTGIELTCIEKTIAYLILITLTWIYKCPGVCLVPSHSSRQTYTHLPSQSCWCSAGA